MELTCVSCRNEVVVLQGGRLQAGIELVDYNSVRAQCHHCGEARVYVVRDIRTSLS